eukprot:TRINITY_DN9007_c0_g1_i1.p1 TRINITY_DN9007_c0_g1~~TRINITY_DN9007_c0_g1_i1.p1  ORF type:complete len:851 (+),score=242.35 TRINITY_DN9007_c0_g1_i1:98-2650(+)
MEVINFGSRHHMATEGLTQAQVATLSVVADEMAENSAEMVRLGEAYHKLLEEMEKKHDTIRKKDEMIVELQKEEAEDITKFKERQSQAITDLATRVEEQASDLACKESELQLRELDIAALQQELGQLRMKTGDQVRRAQRAVEDGDTKLSNMEDELTVRNGQLFEKDSKIADLEADIDLLTDSLTTKRKEAEDYATLSERLSQDLAVLKSSTQAELLRQAAALEESTTRAREAILDSSRMKSENVQLMARINTTDLRNDDLTLDNNRLRDEIERLKKELDDSRKIESDLNIQIRKLELVNNQREATVAQLRQKLQERQRGIDTERMHVDHLADAVQIATERLKVANDLVEKIFIEGQQESNAMDDNDDDDNRSRSNSPSGSHIDPYSAVISPPHSQQNESANTIPTEDEDSIPAILPDEVDRVEVLADQLRALMEVHGWERREDETRHKQDFSDFERKHTLAKEDLERMIKELTKKYEDERDEKRHLAHILQLLRSEEESRAELERQAIGEWNVVLGGVSAMKQHYYAGKIDDCEYLESEARLDIEDLEDAEWGILMQEADEDFNDVIEAIRVRRLKNAKKITKKTAYMGLEVSDGITVKHYHKEKASDGRLLKDGKQIVSDIEGVKVFNVVPNGPAHTAGVLPEDIVTHFNDTKVTTLANFKAAAKQVKPGSKLTLTVSRDGEPIEIVIQTLMLDEGEFEQGVRRKVGHRITVLKEKKLERTRVREARRNELKQSQGVLNRVDIDVDSASDDEKPSTPLSFARKGHPELKHRNGSKSAVPENRAATHTLAGANAGPLTHKMFNQARGLSVASNYKLDEEPQQREPSSRRTASPVPKPRKAVQQPTLWKK